MIEQVNVNVFSNPNTSKYRSLISTLTDRQLDVLACMLFEHSREAEMKTLKITKNTLEEHRRNILKKMNVQYAKDLINWINLRGNEDIVQKLRLRLIELKRNSDKELPMKQAAMELKSDAPSKEILRSDNSLKDKQKSAESILQEAQIFSAVMMGMLISNIFKRSK